jgi:hypothetical protein
VKLSLLAACLITGLLSASLPAYGDTVEKSVQEGFDAMGSAQSDEAFMAAARKLITLGDSALPELTKRLAAAGDEDERVEVTYVIANIVGQAKFKRQKVALPAELVTLAGKLLLETRDAQLEANLANLAGFSPHPAEFGPALLALLERTENEAMRATTSAAIAYQGDEVLPLVETAFAASSNDRYSGDLARILYGRSLNAQSTAKLQKLLKSDNADARKSAARTLEKAGVKSDGLLDAALKDLASATRDVDLSSAAGRVKKHTDGSERVAIALAGAFERARRIEQRVELVAALRATGEPGTEQLFAVLRASNDPQEIRDIMMVTTNSLQNDPRLPAAYIAILKRTDDEKVSEAAVNALLMMRKTGRDAVMAALNETASDDRLHRRLTEAAGSFPADKTSD